MKILIWVSCAFVYAVTVTAFSYAGIVLGALPTILLLATVFAAATVLCKLLDKKKARKAAIPEERWYTCQKCGQLVREGEVCDCETIATADEPVDEPAKKEPEHRRWRYVTATVALCLVVSVLAAYFTGEYSFSRGYENGYNAGRNDGITEERRDIKTQLSEKDATIAELEDKLAEADERSERYLDSFFEEALFLNTKIGFILEGDTEHYHVHQFCCKPIDGTYWAHNIEYCEFLGYERCPECWAD